MNREGQAIKKTRFPLAVDVGKLATASSSTTQGEVDAAAMTIHQILGTYYIHWILMCAAVVLRILSTIYPKWSRSRNQKLTSIEGMVPSWDNLLRSTPTECNAVR